MRVIDCCKKKISKLISIFLVLIFVSFAEAKVNLATGQFSLRRVDFSLDLGNFNLPFWRRYNSNDERTGLFGKGWCSLIEFNLKIEMPGNNAKLFHCGKKKAHFISNKSQDKGYTYLKSKDRLLVLDGNFGRTLVFNLQGRLVQIYLTQLPKKKVIIDYNSGINISYKNKKVRLLLKTGRVHSVFFNGKSKVRFLHKNDFLVKELIKGKGTTSYAYRDGLLSKFKDAKGKVQKIQFSKEKIIQSYQMSSGCLENYRYTKRGARVQVRVLRSCSKSNSVEERYVFGFDKSRQLASVQDVQKKSTKFFDPTSYEVVGEKNLVSQKKFDRDKLGRVRKAKIYNGKKTYTVKLDYNGRQETRRLTYSENGQTQDVVNLAYKNGLLTRIMNQKRKRFVHFYRTSGYIRKISSPRGVLKYIYGDKSKLEKMSLKVGKMKVHYNLRTKKGTRGALGQIAGYLNQVFAELGPLHRDSNLLSKLVEL